MSEQDAADFEPLISREQAENAFRAALNLFIGRGRQYSTVQVAKATGVAKRKIECFRSYTLGHPDYRPLDDGDKLSITAFLGARFTNEWLTLAGQGAFDLPDEEPDPGNVAADNSDDNADLTRKALDGTFANDCPQEMTALGTRMASRGMHLVSLARARA